jgi:hypothetical protein
MQVPKEPKCRLLDRVASIVGVAQQTHTKAKPGVLKLTQQGGLSIAIPAAGGFYSNLVHHSYESKSLCIIFMFRLGSKLYVAEILQEVPWLSALWKG